MNQYNLTMEQITAYRTWLSGEEKSAGTIENTCGTLAPLPAG